MPDFQFVTTNVKATVRNEKMEDRDYLVAPMVMITEGVHNGSDGPIFYPKEELDKITPAWDHRPVVVYHPVQNGQGVSACEPAELSARKVGITMSSSFDDGKVKGEAWLEPARMEKVDNRVSVAIEQNEMMELSTGLFMNLDRTPGEWNGEPYIGTARNLILDHLALLPDSKGACSIADGAGLLRLNEMSHGSIRMKLSVLIADDVWIEDVYDNFFVFEKDVKLYRQSYLDAEDEVTLVDDVEEVVRVVEYRKATDGKFVGNDKVIEKGTTMDKEKVVNALISNENTPWSDDDREELMAMNDKALEQLELTIKAPEAVAPVANEEPSPAVTEPVVNIATPVPKTMEQYISDAPEGIREVLNSSVASLQREKAKLIAIITGNSRNTFTEEYLKACQVVELQSLARLAAPPVTENNNQPDYLGQEDAVVTNTEEPLGLPVMNFQSA